MYQLEQIVLDRLNTMDKDLQKRAVWVRSGQCVSVRGWKDTLTASLWVQLLVHLATVGINPRVRVAGAFCPCDQPCFDNAMAFIVRQAGSLSILLSWVRVDESSVDEARRVVAR